MNTSEPHALYRFYDSGGQLLYVGITNNPGNRFDQHRSTKEWWLEVAGITVEWYDDRDAVLAAERRAIHIESPLYNEKRPSIGRAPRATSGPRRHTRRQDHIEWKCQFCKTKIADGNGYLRMDVHEAMERRRVTARMRRDRAAVSPTGAYGSVDIAFLLSLPEDVPWTVTCKVCDPDEAGNSYWIAIERIRTHAQALNWTAHLMDKVWLEHTNWQNVLYHVAKVDA